MAQSPPTQSSQQRPWYYQNWFLIGSFILGWPIGLFGFLWPAWAFLILRSPWHNNILLKGLGWAMLGVGGIMFARAFTDDDLSVGRPVANLIPGLVVTFLTQVMWSRYKVEHRLGGQPLAGPAGPPKESTLLSRRERARRRVQRRRRSR